MENSDVSHSEVNESVRAFPLSKNMGATQQRIAKDFLSARTNFQEDISSGVAVGDVVVGGSQVSWFVGPSYVDTVEQMVATGCVLEQNGVKFIRARSFLQESEYSLKQRPKVENLKLLRATAKRFNLKVVTEIVDIRDIPLLLEYADVIEVGPRNANNRILLEELGRHQTVVLLHRSGTSSLDFFLDMIAAVEQGGNAKLILVDSGVRTFDPTSPVMMDISSLVTLKRETTHPVFVDCSMIAKNWTFAHQIASAAIAGGADGILADLQPQPEESLVMLFEQKKCLFPDQLKALVKKVKALKMTLNAVSYEAREALEA